jgi:hypothetical protein
VAVRAQNIREAGAAEMPQLAEDLASFRVHGVDDFFPARDL